MAGPIFPDVPDALGVPAVQRIAGAVGATEPKLSEDGITVTATAKDQWGIYTEGGALVLDADSVMSIGYDAESRIADYPIEEGGFETYDKVALPYHARVVLTKGGSIADRREFLAKLEEVRVDLELYNIVTPERTYLSANIARVSIDRSREQGANLITADIIVQEVRANATASFTASQQPSGADVQSNGVAQPKAADAGTQATVEAKSAAVTSGTSRKPFFSSAAGQTLMTIATVATLPAQAVAVQLAGKSVGISLLQKATGLFANVSMNGLPVVAGVLCRDAVPLINAAHLGFPGDLAIFDMQGGEDPNYADLGSRFKLMWASA